MRMGTGTTMVRMVVTMVGVAAGFNLHTDLALVVPGPSHTYFGYSVALWHNNKQGHRLVVGAPRGRNTTAGNMTLPLGNLHFCDAFSGKCQVDPNLPILSEKDKSLEAASWSDSIRSQGIGLGESVYTSKGSEAKLVTCAPRYPKMVDSSLQGRGACYVLNQEHDSPTTIVPFPYNYYMLSGVYLRNDHRYTGMGLAGFSVCVTQNEHRVIMGVPYAFYAQGAVVSRQTDVVDGVEYTSRATYGSTELDFSSEGWATVAGKFDGVEMYIATSTPNTLLFDGLVRFYREDLTKVPAELPGEDVGAKYGYSLAGGDLDGDTADDLVVGAPLAPGVNSAPDAGKVYIYYSPLKERAARAALVLRGQQAWGRFGQAVMCPGDLNQDGFQDVVVGAPGGEGGVFVYSGSVDGLIPDPTQVIYASQFAGGLRGFGFSLDGGLDVDLNGYPDVIVGSPQSDTAVFIRSSPVVTLVGSVSFDPSIIPLGNKSCPVNVPGGQSLQDVTCFNLHIDLQYKSKAIRDILNIELSMVLDDEEQRLAFLDNLQYKLTSTVEITSIHEAKQRSRLSVVTVYVKPGRPRLDTPVKVTVNARLEPVAAEEVHIIEGSEGRNRGSSIQRVPSGSAKVLPQVIPTVLDVLSTASFTAGARLVCDDEASCFSKPDLHLLALDTPRLVVGEGSLAVGVVVGVRNDTAFSVQISLVYQKQLVFRRVSGDVHIPRCGSASITENDTNSLTCRFASDLLKDEEVTLTLHFEYTPEILLDHLLTSGDTKVTLHMNVTSDSLDLNEKDNSISLDIPTTSKVALHVAGTANPDNVEGRVNMTVGLEDLANTGTLESPGRLGPHFTHTYTIVNHGPSPLLSLRVLLALPLQQGTGLPLFYLVDPLRTSGPITCVSPTLNPRKFNFTSDQDENGREDTSMNDDSTVDDSMNDDSTVDDSLNDDSTVDDSMNDDSTVDDPRAVNTLGPPQHRRRRQAGDATPPGDTPEEPLRRLHEDVDGGTEGDDDEVRLGEVISLNCQHVSCQLITCEVAALKTGMTVGVAVTGYAVVASLQFLRHRSVLMETQVTVEVDHHYDYITGADQNVTAGTLVTIIRPVEASARTISWWHWVLVLIISLLIILIIMAVLKRVGFFERQRVSKEQRESIKKRAEGREGEEEHSQEEEGENI